MKRAAGEPAPRRNRVDPWGDLHSVPDRGLFTGNRGCLADESRAVVRHHRGTPWITCLTSFRGHHHPLDDPHRWTPLFFLDEAVALAAGHRPCAYCRRTDYRSYLAAVARTLGVRAPLRAAELDRRLAAERLRRGRGMERAQDRILWTARADELPDGTVIVAGDTTRLILGASTHRFSFDGWVDPAPRPGGPVTVLTPPTSVAALRGGYEPVVHPSARAATGGARR